MPRLFARTPSFLLTLGLSASCLGLLQASPGQGRPRPRPEGRISDSAAGSLVEPSRQDAGPPLLHSVPAGPGAGLLSLADTVYYGGTAWSAANGRYEAIRGGTWTFDSGVGSSLVTTPGGCKPVGYHQTMEGWEEFVLNDMATSSGWRRRPEFAIHGTRSMHLGWTQAEAESLCYAAGAGYGSRWNEYLTKTYNYSGSGSVTLSFDYAVDVEGSYDYLIVLVDSRTSGTPEFSSAVEVARYTDLVSGRATFTLHPGTELPNIAGPVRIIFQGISDGGYDDEDGLAPTTRGLATLDDITLSGALVDASDFETSVNGWSNLPHECDPGGAYADLRALSTLPSPGSCAGQCAMSDSVLTFADPSGGHPLHSEEFAASPWIDLQAGGDAGRPGRFIEYDGFFQLPTSSDVSVTCWAQYYPYACPATGLVTDSPWRQYELINFFGGVANCTPVGAPTRVPLDGLIPAGAQRVRIGVGLLNQCSLFATCTGITNSTPWFDNVRLGVCYPRPALTLSPVLQFTDAFATDGTLDPASTARVDCSRRPAAGRAPGDTLVCTGDGGNQEVRINFRVRPGPFLNAPALAAWAAAHWTPNPVAGPGWWSARLDTAEANGVVSAGRWMTTLHESDPQFGGGTDRDRGADGDATQLSHDIFPDHLLTPGSRIDYFLTARYLPPDARNPAGDLWSILPDTTRGNYLEMEVLPTSMTADSTWNCVLHVNAAYTARAASNRAVIDAGMTAQLGGGGLNAEGARFDRFDVLATGSGAAGLGRPAGLLDGATATQLAAYGVVAASALPGDAEVAVYTPWLAASTPAQPRHFWLWGNAPALHSGSASQQAFLHDVLGVNVIGSFFENTGCFALRSEPGAHFANSLSLSLGAPTCAPAQVFTGTVNPALASSVRVQTASSTGTYRFGFSRIVPGTAARTLFDCLSPVDLRRTSSACLFGVDDAPAARVADVLTWFGWPNGGSCTPNGVSDVPPDGAGPAPRPLELTAVSRHAASGGWRVAFSLPARGTATLRLFDVTGRVVRTLLDAEPFDAGAQEIIWDGRGARGERVVAGLYFLRLASGGEASTRKLVVRE